ncbi:MAG: carboxypeptidase-like regulatory domain-containing protein [Acidobacteria bacterium]|nr:carboxypeptidase-like regulatory domain-containing protein [Acidobacteriota bacterium]
MNGVTIKPVLLIILSIYLGMVASAQPAQSAQSKGIIAGRITDRSSGAITSAKVILKNVASGAELMATTDASGHYQFSSIPAGIYRAVASNPNSRHRAVAVLQWDCS